MFEFQIDDRVCRVNDKTVMGTVFRIGKAKIAICWDGMGNDIEIEDFNVIEFVSRPLDYII